MTLPVYITGTVSVSNLGTVVTGVGCMWSGINAREGDFFTRADGVAIITEVTDATHLKITPWPGATVAGGAYAIQQNYVGRVVGVAAAEDVGVMLEKLHVDGLPFIVGADETVPDPSYGDEGQMAFKPDTGQWWVKSGGAWVPSAGLTALGYGGTSTTSLLIATGSKVFTTQTDLAYNGARVRAASAANLNNWMEGVSTYSGTTLTMTCDKIGGSGTHADWLLSIAGQPGVDGLGAGDVIGPASAVIDNIATYAATTGKLIKDGGVLISSLQPVNQAVRYDTPQTLTDDVGVTAGQKTQARQNIYAAPFDAMAYSGMQINGSMEIDQPSNGIAYVIPPGPFTNVPLIDSWRFTKSGSNAFTVQSVASVFPGYGSEMKLAVTTAQPTVGADFIVLDHSIEGYRFARMQWGTATAQPVTVGFWVKSSVAGTMGVQLYNAGGASGGSASVTITAANTAQWCVATFAPVTTGTWGKTNGVGAFLRLNPMSSAGINIAATVGNTFEVTGLVILPGIEAPSAARAPLIMRPYDQELVTCQRYWQPAYAAVDVMAGGAGIVSVQGVTLAPQMRATPTLTPSIIGSANMTATVAINAGPRGFVFQSQSVAAGRCYWYGSYLCDARL